MATPEPLRLLCADLSLRCPGFAILTYSDGIATVESLCHLDNQGSRAGHGEILSAIYDLLVGQSKDATVFVREKGFSRFPRETQALSKVAGIADLVAWQQKRDAFHELAPSSIKKILTGSGKAAKEEVACSLERYVGKLNYATDDESDAAAAGIAWQIVGGLLQETPKTQAENFHA